MLAVRDVGPTKGHYPRVDRISIAREVISIETDGMVRWIGNGMELAVGTSLDLASVPGDVAYVRAEVSNPEGTKVYSYAEGKEALKKGKINFEGASSVLDFDQYGDVSPSFGVFFIEGGKLNRRYVVNI